MKKALAIVLTLLLVASLLPPALAVTETVTGGPFTVTCAPVDPKNPDSTTMESALFLAEKHYEFSYEYSALSPVEVGKFTGEV